MKKVRRSLLLALLCPAVVFGQITPSPEIKGKQKVRTVTIPISIFTKAELKSDKPEEFIQANRLIVREDKEEQTILTMRSVANTPLTLAILVQDDLTSDFNLQLKSLKEFIRGLPSGSRIMVAYVRGGTLDIRQRFTEDRNQAANALRIVTSSASSAPRSPYDSLVDVLPRFDAQPAGRRAILLISDGLDTSEGIALGSPLSSSELNRAIERSQRRSVAVYSFYSPASSTAGGNSSFVLQGQGSLQRLADETGGRAFFQGSIAPVSFDPFFKDLVIMLNRQFALTYLSTHMNRGYHKLDVISTNPDVKIQHPKGYYYR